MRRRAAPRPIAPPGITLAELRAVAIGAVADPRTVARRLRDEPVRGDVAHRIDEELARRGLLVASAPTAAPEPTSALVAIIGGQR